MSCVMRKSVLAIGICQNNRTSAFRHWTADQYLCFCYIDSAIPLLPKSKISSLRTIMALSLVFVSDLVEKPVVTLLI